MRARRTIPILWLWALSACFSIPTGEESAPGDGPEAPDAAQQASLGDKPAPAAASKPPDVTTARAQLRCVFEGQRFLNAKQLEAALKYELQAWTEGLSIEVVADDCAYQLTEHYRSLGFASASVFVKPSQDSQGSYLAFTIQEGKRSIVTEFQFPGAVESEELGPTSLRALYSKEKRPVWIQRDQNALPNRVADRYRAKGFLDATAGPARLEILPDPSDPLERWVRVAVPIAGGQRYMLVEVTHDLSEELTKKVRLQAAIDDVVPKLNVPFEPQWVPKWQRAIEGALTNSGYLDAHVQASVEKDAEHGKVRVRWSIEPGEQVHLGEIRYPVDTKVRSSFLDEQIGLAPGDTISSKTVDEALSKLYGTGLFRTVGLQIVGTGESRDLVAELEEWPTRETFLEPGYGSFEGARLRAGWRHHNVLGVGRTLRVEGVVAEQASRALIGWSDPWTLGGGWILDANSDLSQRKLPAFRRDSNSVGVFASRDFGSFDRWTVHTGLRFEDISLNRVKVELLAGSGIEEDLSITTVEGGISYDSRNHPLLPTHGQKAHFTVQQTVTASGAANPFAKILGGWSYYRPLSDSQVLSIGARGVGMFPGDGAPNPLGLRIFSGGENSVRSFRESELGPLDADGTPLGGEASSTFSIELNQRLGSSMFQAAAFVDVGNVVAKASQLFEFRDLETALGVGVRYVLPIGPLRLDWAHNPNAGAFQSEWVLHFSVGMAF